MSTRRTLLVAAALLSMTACGPKHSVTLGVRDVSTDILLKENHTVTPPPSVTPPPGFPFVPTPVGQPGPVNGGNYVPLPPLPSEDPASPPPACPEASPYSGASHPADVRPPAPPQAGAYATRVDGNFAITGPHAAQGAYGPGGVRIVKNVAQLPNDVGWTYDITDEFNLTTSYEVIPRQLGQDQTPVESPNQPVPTQAGIYVTSFVYTRADKTQLSLKPNPPLMVAKLPFVTSDRWSAHSTDAASGVAITVNGQTGLGIRYQPSKDRIDACGTVLDAYWVEYTVDTTPIADQTKNSEPPSEISGPMLSVQFVGSKVAFGPQYGGLPLEESYVLAGTDNGSNLKITRHSVISVEPKLAKVPAS
jgi:hypothetical protein